MREAVLAAALPHAAFDGFTDSAGRRPAMEAGRGKDDAGAAVSGRAPSAWSNFIPTAADAEMEKRLAAMDLKAMKIRERIAAAVLARLAVLKPHKEAARRAAAASVAAACMRRWARSCCIAPSMRCGARPATPRPISISTPSAASWPGSMARPLMRWFNDTSEDETATDEFLAARIENVMQFEKFKAQAKEALCANFPAFAETSLKPSTVEQFRDLHRVQRRALQQLVRRHEHRDRVARWDRDRSLRMRPTSISPWPEASIGIGK